MHSQEFIKEMESQLLAHKQRLEEDLKGLSGHTEVGEDEDENATEVQIDEVNQDAIFRMGQDLEKVNAALAKIAAGTYGTDAEGKEISEERLRAIPWADTSI